MANRICSFCGEGYTDETGHDYDACVKRCQELLGYAHENLRHAARYLVNSERNLVEAKRVQGQNWWRPKSKIAKVEGKLSN